MFELIKNIISSPAGSFGFVFSILCLLFFLAHKSGIILQQFKSVPKLSDNIDKIKEDIAEIKAFMRVIKQEHNDLVKSHSPLSLTNKGKGIAKDLKVKEILQRQWSDLTKIINKELNIEHNPYDIQEVCFSIGRNYSKLLTPDESDFIRRYAFKQGNNLSDYDLLFGVVLRDLYFADNNIQVSDITQFE